MFLFIIVIIVGNIMHQPLVVQIFIVVGFDIDAGGISGFCQTPARSASKMVPRRNSRMK